MGLEVLANEVLPLVYVLFVNIRIISYEWEIFPGGIKSLIVLQNAILCYIWPEGTLARIQSAVLVFALILTIAPCRIIYSLIPI